MGEYNQAQERHILRSNGVSAAFVCLASFSDIVLSVADPFKHPVEYNPTDKAEMDTALSDARRMLVPHTILLHMLRSRFQAVRYRNPGLMQLLLRLVLRSTRKGVTLRLVPPSK